MQDNKSIPNPAFTHSQDTDYHMADSQNKEKNVKQTTQTNTSSVDSIGKYTFATLAIGEKSFKYIAIFKKITEGNFIIPSKQAGLFGLAWLIYRRASFYGSLVYMALIYLAYNFITKAEFIPKVFQILAIFGFTHLVFYFIGNFLYWYSVHKKIDTFRYKYGDTSAMTYLSEKGGTINGFNLIASVLMLQGSAILVVAGSIYMDDFMLILWNGFLELAHL